MKKMNLKTDSIKIYVGIDVHKWQRNVTLLSPHLHLKAFSQAPDPGVLKLVMDNHYPDAEVNCAYEVCHFSFS